MLRDLFHHGDGPTYEGRKRRAASFLEGVHPSSRHALPVALPDPALPDLVAFPGSDVALGLGGQRRFAPTTRPRHMEGRQTPSDLSGFMFLSPSATRGKPTSFGALPFPPDDMDDPATLIATDAPENLPNLLPWCHSERCSHAISWKCTNPNGGAPIYDPPKTLGKEEGEGVASIGQTTDEIGAHHSFLKVFAYGTFLGVVAGYTLKRAAMLARVMELLQKRAKEHKAQKKAGKMSKEERESLARAMASSSEESSGESDGGGEDASPSSRGRSGSRGSPGGGRSRGRSKDGKKGKKSKKGKGKSGKKKGKSKDKKGKRGR